MPAASTHRIAERQPGSFWVPVLCGGVILTIGIGARQSFGIFQKPIAAELGVGRELWSFANALSMLLRGLLSPFVGNFSDRFGTARTVAAGGIVYVAGIFMIALASEGVMLTVGSLLCGIGTAAAGFGPIFGAISRKTPERQPLDRARRRDGWRIVRPVAAYNKDTSDNCRNRLDRPPCENSSETSLPVRLTNLSWSVRRF